MLFNLNTNPAALKRPQRFETLESKPIHDDKVHGRHVRDTIVQRFRAGFVKQYLTL